MTDRTAKRPRTDGEAPSGVADDPTVGADGVPDYSAALNEVQEELNRVRSTSSGDSCAPCADVSPTAAWPTVE